jgi:hypothetical protein
MVCCNLIVWSYWGFTFIVSCLYSSLTLSSIGVKWKCIGNLSACVDDDIVNNATKTGAVVSSFVTMFQTMLVLFALINNKKRFQGYCIGSSFHITIIMLWYAVCINTSSQKIEHWTASSVKDLFDSSYYLACLLAGIHFVWIFVKLNLITNDHSVCANEV